MYSDADLKPKIWNFIQPKPADERNSRLIPMSRSVCRVLLNRGLHDPDEAKRFLEPSLDNLHDPACSTAWIGRSSVLNLLWTVARNT